MHVGMPVVVQCSAVTSLPLLAYICTCSVCALACRIGMRMSFDARVSPSSHHGSHAQTTTITLPCSLSNPSSRHLLLVSHPIYGQWWYMDTE